MSKKKKKVTSDNQAAGVEQPVKVTEVSVMVSKKLSVNFHSCCVSYSVKANLDESNNDYLKALDDLKNQLVAKVQEALNGNRNGNGNAQPQQQASAQGGQE
jgi:hypothetical protein